MAGYLHAPGRRQAETGANTPEQPPVVRGCIWSVRCTGHTFRSEHDLPRWHSQQSHHYRQKRQDSGKQFQPTIEPPYRWRDWAAHEDGISGPELIAFVNQDTIKQPDGSEQAGLFA